MFHQTKTGRDPFSVVHGTGALTPTTFFVFSIESGLGSKRTQLSLSLCDFNNTVKLHVILVTSARDLSLEQMGEFRLLLHKYKIF